MNKVSILRITGWVFAGVFLVTGICFFLFSHMWYKNFDTWFNAYPVNIQVDFSKPGEYVAVFEQTCSVAHGEIVGVEVPREVLDEITNEQLILGLEGRVSIADARGNEVFCGSIPTEKIRFGGPYFENTIPLNEVYRFEKGTYQISISITKGAPGLRNVNHRFVARYLLCGLERMPGFIARVISILLLIVGIVVTFVLIKRTKAERSLNLQ